MHRVFIALWLVFATFGCAITTTEVMSQELLAKHIESIAGRIEGSLNVIEFQYESVSIACVSDSTHNRMRLITSIAKVDSLRMIDLETLLTANFHTTLDARYAISEGVIYAAYLHPLSSLSREQLESAIRQVSALSRNFGSSYSIGELMFGSSQHP
ncbi:MAG: hypothetical protein IIB72_12085, partial [Proteobacteria bacterium]|nr:hypothetical protein [Pseudomonadota bacterium]